MKNLTKNELLSKFKISTIISQNCTQSHCLELNCLINIIISDDFLRKCNYVISLNKIICYFLRETIIYVILHTKDTREDFQIMSIKWIFLNKRHT